MTIGKLNGMLGDEEGWGLKENREERQGETAMGAGDFVRDDRSGCQSLVDASRPRSPLDSRPRDRGNCKAFHRMMKPRRRIDR